MTLTFTTSTNSNLTEGMTQILERLDYVGDFCSTGNPLFISNGECLDKAVIQQIQSGGFPVLEKTDGGIYVKEVLPGTYHLYTKHNTKTYSNELLMIHESQPEIDESASVEMNDGFSLGVYDAPTYFDDTILDLDEEALNTLPFDSSVPLYHRYHLVDLLNNVPASIHPFSVRLNAFGDLYGRVTLFFNEDRQFVGCFLRA